MTHMGPVGWSIGAVVRLFAVGRVAAGVALLARPEMLARGMRIDSGTAHRTGWMARMLGVRDLALGAGTLYALTRGGQPRPWLVLSAAADAVDAATLAGALRRGQVAVPPAALGAGMAAVSVAAHLAVAAGPEEE